MHGVLADDSLPHADFQPVDFSVRGSVNHREPRARIATAGSRSRRLSHVTRSDRVEQIRLIRGCEVGGDVGGSAALDEFSAAADAAIRRPRFSDALRKEAASSSFAAVSDDHSGTLCGLSGGSTTTAAGLGLWRMRSPTTSRGFMPDISLGFGRRDESR